MVKDETLRNENEIFKTNLEEKLIPQIRERIDNGENRIEYTEEEIKQILEVDYTTENFYQRFKTMLLNTEIGVSIKRIPGNNKFTFFERLDGVKRESDLFKAKFEHSFKPKLIEYLNSHISIGIPEDWLKAKLDMVGYSTSGVYKKLRDMLVVSEITISIERKSDGNGFIFYNKKLAEEHDARVDKEVKEYEEKRKIILEAERQEELNRPYPEDLFSDITSRFPPHPKSLEPKFLESEEVRDRNSDKKIRTKSPESELDHESTMRFYEKENDDGEDNFDSLSKCPVCGSDVVMFSPECHGCGIVLKWKEEG